jgi:hypothetical protein
MHGAGLPKTRRSGRHALLSQEGSAGPKGPREGGSRANLVTMRLRNHPSRDLA